MNELVNYHYRLLVGKDMTKNRNKTKICCESMTHVIAESVGRWTNQLLVKNSSEDETDQKVWIVRKLFCAVRYINDAWYVGKYRTLIFEMFNKSKNLRLSARLVSTISKGFLAGLELLHSKRYLVLITKKNC